MTFLLLDSAPKTSQEIEMENQMLYPNPEKSIYYHPIFNPYGAPPPGAKQVYIGELSSMSKQQLILSRLDSASNRLKGVEILALTGSSVPIVMPTPDAAPKKVKGCIL